MKAYNNHYKNHRKWPVPTPSTAQKPSMEVLWFAYWFLMKKDIILEIHFSDFYKIWKVQIRTFFIPRGSFIAFYAIQLKWLISALIFGDNWRRFRHKNITIKRCSMIIILNSKCQTLRHTKFKKPCFDR